MDGHQRDRFRDVERRAAAQTDHRICAMFLERGNAGIDLACNRIARHARENFHRETLQRRLEFAEQRQRRDALVRDDQRPLAALRRKVRGGLAPRAGAEMNIGRESETMDSS